MTSQLPAVRGRLLSFCPIVVLVVLLSVPALGQEVSARASLAPAPAHIAFIDGAASVEREGRIETALANVPLSAGDRLKTELGRVELLFPDGSALHVDHKTTVDVLSETRLRLVQGRVNIFVSSSAAAVYQVDTAAGAVQIEGAGEYRVALLTGLGRLEVELAVVRGEAQLANDLGVVPVRTGERAVANAERAPGFPQIFNSARWDAFDLWSQQRRGDRRYAGASYLPDPLQPYAADLHRYGQWQTDPTYGSVWYPAVAPTWRPYFHGSWRHYSRFGWTWIGFDTWSWPTHHYGRWNRSWRGWFWVPSLTWGPAWVHWAYAPNYVSWCPIDPFGRPVGGFFWGASGFHGSRVSVRGSRFGHDPSWWVVAPRRVLGSGIRIDRSAVDVGSLPVATRSSFVNAPTPHYAVPRDLYRGSNRPTFSVPRSTIATPGRAPDSGFASARRSPTAEAIPRGGQIQSAPRGTTDRPGQAAPAYRTEPSRRYPSGLGAPDRSEGATRVPQPGVAVPRSAPFGGSPRSDSPTPRAPQASEPSAPPPPPSMPEHGGSAGAPTGMAVPRREGGDRGASPPPPPAPQSGAPDRSAPRREFGRPAPPPPPSSSPPPSRGGGAVGRSRRGS